MLDWYRTIADSGRNPLRHLAPASVSDDDHSWLDVDSPLLLGCRSVALVWRNRCFAVTKRVAPSGSKSGRRHRPPQHGGMRMEGAMAQTATLPLITAELGLTAISKKIRRLKRRAAPRFEASVRVASSSPALPSCAQSGAQLRPSSPPSRRRLQMASRQRANTQARQLLR